MSQRRFPRVEAVRPVVLETFDGAELARHFVRAETIGLGGCMVRCPAPLARGTEVAVRICLAGGVIRAESRVAYVRAGNGRGYEIGLEFLSIPEADRPLLDAVVARGGVARAAAGEGAAEPAE